MQVCVCVCVCVEISGLKATGPRTVSNHAGTETNLTTCLNNSSGKGIYDAFSYHLCCPNTSFTVATVKTWLEGARKNNLHRIFGHTREETQFK